MAQTAKKAYANVNASSTQSELVAAVSRKSIRVVSVAMVCGATATTSTFNSASTAISCLFANGANGGAVLNYNFDGWFETTPGQALTVTTGAGSATGYLISYLEI